MGKKFDKVREELEGEGVSDNDLPVSAIKSDSTDVLVPAMTEHEILAGQASRGKKIVRISPPDRVLPSIFKDILSGSYMYFMKYKMVPDAEELHKTYCPQYKVSDLKKVLTSPQYRYAMMVRGIDMESENGLTAFQEAAISIMATPSGKPFETKLRMAGVAPSTWRAWLRNPKFREVWDDIGGSVLKDHENDMLVALVGQANNGDVSAIKYAFEVSGKYSPNRQQNIDATLFVAQVLEIIQEEVKDIETLQRIAARMQMMGQAPASRSVISAVQDKPEIEG